MSAGRANYSDVGKAQREAARIVLEERAPTGVLRVLLALFHDVTSWSRLHETTSRSRLADLTGLDTRQVTRSLRWLREHGVIEWIPGGSPMGGRRVLSRVTFPVPTGDTTDHRSEKSPVTSRYTDRGAEKSQTGDISIHRPGGPDVPHTEKNPEGFFREAHRRPSASAAGAPAATSWLQSIRDYPPERHVEFEAKADRLRFALHDKSASDRSEEVDAVVEYIAEYGAYLLSYLAEEVRDQPGGFNRPRDLLRLALDSDDDSAIAELGHVVKTEGGLDREGMVSAVGSILSDGALPAWWPHRHDPPYAPPTPVKATA